MLHPGAIKKLFISARLLLFCILPCSSLFAAGSTKDTLDEAHFQLEDLLDDEGPQSTVIPFIKAGNLIIVKGRADTVEGNFILDTGAPYLILNLIYFRDYPVTVTGEVSNGIGSAGDPVQKTRLEAFRWGDFIYNKITADLVDLGHLENSKGMPILGLIGLSLLRHCEMIIDYERSELHLRRIPKKEKEGFLSVALSEDDSYSQLPFDIINKKIVAQVDLSGRNLKFVIDSGAETNILDSRLPNRVFEHVTVTGQLTIRGTGRNTVKALRGEIDKIRFGAHDLSNLPVVVANLEESCFSVEGCANGVLGLHFMPLRKIGFNFVTRKMYLWK